MNRRQFIQLSSALALGFSAPSLLAKQQGRDPRLVLLILRGGMDGLAAVPPWGDAHYASARGDLALAKPGAQSGVIDLDGFFGLHPAFENLAQLYRQQELAVVQAVAPPYAGRSHFDAQDVLETGLLNPSGSSEGWLYRALDGLKATVPEDRYAYALGNTVPRVLRGDKTVGAWSPDRLPEPDEDTLSRVMALYDQDSLLGPRLKTALQTDALVSGMDSMQGKKGGRNQLPEIASAAATFLRMEDGPRVAVMEAGGWDTHARQGTDKGLLANRFAELDRVTGRFREEMGGVWRQTAMLVVTEFGRTVAMNGTAGSDHGVGGAAFLLGGAVQGGRVHSQWPGLAPAQLNEGRDLKTTTDMRALFAGVLHEHMGLSRQVLANRVFPGFEGRLSGLIRQA